MNTNKHQTFTDSTRGAAHCLRVQKSLAFRLIDILRLGILLLIVQKYDSDSRSRSRSSTHTAADSRRSFYLFADAFLIRHAPIKTTTAAAATAVPFAFAQTVLFQAGATAASDTGSSDSGDNTLEEETSIMACAAGKNAALKLRVVSYNVLSTHLASPNHFTTLKPEHLEASKRLPVVLDKILNEIQSNPSHDKIFCLQEVSYDWAGAFHTFFANHGYHMVCGLYGKKFNGYMGVCVAWPTSAFETIDVDISRLSDKREGGWPPKDEKPTIVNLWNDVVMNPLRKLGIVAYNDAEPWEYAEQRFNVIVTVTLQQKRDEGWGDEGATATSTTGKSFCISNYHMPCAFWSPPIMTIHADMAVRHVQRIASERGGIPYVFAGDWNIKPIDSIYRLLTTGESMDSSDPFFPKEKNGYVWTPSSKAVRSSYAEYNGGKEPEFTNYARVKENDPFIDTLDYIFISESWKVESVQPLPKRDDANGPFPNLDYGEPSDHILIASNLVLKDDSTES